MTVMNTTTPAELARRLPLDTPTGELQRRLERVRTVRGGILTPGDRIDVRNSKSIIIGEAVALDDGTVQIMTEESG